MVAENDGRGTKQGMTMDYKTNEIPIYNYVSLWFKSDVSWKEFRCAIEVIISHSNKAFYPRTLFIQLIISIGCK